MNFIQRAYRAICHPRELLRDIPLYIAGHRRCAPYGTRGRTHTKPGDDQKGSPLRAMARPVASIVPTRVYCEKDKRWYTMDEWRDREE